MTDVPEQKPKMTARDRAEMILKMTRESDRVARRTGAEACIVICVFREGNQLTIQDAGKFVMPPAQLYNTMINAHTNGQLGSPRKILKPH